VNRAVRVATIVANDPHRELLPPLLDATWVAVKPDWWTMTGWERSPESIDAEPHAYVQSWILIPVDVAEIERARTLGGASRSNVTCGLVKHVARVELELLLANDPIEVPFASRRSKILGQSRIEVWFVP